MREEEKALREIEKAKRDAEKEEEALRKAMEKAQSDIEKSSAEERAKFEQKLLELTERLRTAEEKNQRAISLAQQTRRGHVYVISNIGSFGEHVYKIGMTRRFEPMDRVHELGDASVPFEFDVHALIKSDERAGARARSPQAVRPQPGEQGEPRREFFRIQLTEICQEINSMGWRWRGRSRPRRASFERRSPRSARSPTRPSTSGPGCSSRSSGPVHPEPKRRAGGRRSRRVAGLRRLRAPALGVPRQSQGPQGRWVRPPDHARPDGRPAIDGARASPAPWTRAKG